MIIEIDIGGLIQMLVYVFSAFWAFVLFAIYLEDRHLVSILPSKPKKSKKK